MSSGELLRMKGHRGFTYVGVLLGVALIGVGLIVTATVWSKEAERQRKTEIEWVLTQYERALRSYYNTAPGSVKTLPTSLTELLLDQRHLRVVRHLRKNYEVICGEGQSVRVGYEPKAASATLLVVCTSGEAFMAQREIILGASVSYPLK